MFLSYTAIRNARLEDNEYKLLNSVGASASVPTLLLRSRADSLPLSQLAVSFMSIAVQRNRPASDAALTVDFPQKASFWLKKSELIAVRTAPFLQ
ncbi:MAG: hypothetical protein FWD64_03765 [Acidobacteriaceae bacterium]|nr:hypothetical protein [Acidobacteriaceae bacterium]